MLAVFHNLTSNTTVENSFPIGRPDCDTIVFSSSGCPRKDEQGGECRKGCSEADELKVTAVRKESAE